MFFNSTKNSYLKDNLETKVFLFFSIVFILVFQSLSYFSLWVETEIYPVHSSQYLFTEHKFEFLFALKLVFYLILYLSSLFSDLFALFPMTGARFLFALNGLLILALMYFYINKKTNRYNAVLAVLVLASANIFLDRGFRVRSDLLVSALSLVILLLTLNIKSHTDYLKFYTVIPLLFSLFIISPKGIYWFFFTLCLMLYDLKGKIPSRWLIIKAVSAICIVFSLLSFIFRDPFFFKTVYQSASLYLLDFSTTWQFIFEENLINNWTELSHISLFVERNLILVLLISVKFLFVIYSIVVIRKRKWNLSDLYFCFLLLVLLFHPQQKLFFLCAITPFFIISFFTDWQWRQLINHHYSLRFKTFLLAGAFLYSLFYISFFSYRIYVKKNNRPQKELIGKLNGFYKNIDPLISIFDPSCLVYMRKTDCKYILDDINWKKTFKPYFKNHNFDLVLASRFLDLFELTHYEQSSFQYININNHIYYKALIFDLTKRKNLLKILEFNRNISFTNTQFWDSKDKLQKLQKHSPFLDIKTLDTKHNQKDKEVIISKVESEKGKLFQSQRTAGYNKTSLQTNILSGKKLLKILLSTLETKAPEASREYSYFFLDSHNKPIKKLRDCQKKKGKILILQSGCPYSRKEFAVGLIPIEQERLALFYLPMLLDIPEELSLRALFRYDMF